MPVLCLGRFVGFALATVLAFAIGCNSSQPPEGGDGPAEADHEHDHAHEEEEHAGHDHPPHGPHGGHLLSLSPGDAHAEWDHRNDQDQVIVYTTELGDAVEAVAMRYQIQGQESQTVEFEPAAEIGEDAYQATSPELLTAIQAGDAADVALVVTVDGEERTAAVEHHEH